MEKITVSRLKRLLSSQPYYVWHDPKSKNDDEEEEDDDNFSFKLPDPDEVAETSFSEIQKKTFGIIESRFNEFASGKFMYAKFINAKTQEEKIKQTLDFLNDESVDVIIDPVFAYNFNDEYQAIANPKIYKKSTKEFFMLKLSCSTKKVDILKAWYIHEILVKNNVPVENIGMFAIGTREYAKGEVQFTSTRYVALSSGASAKKAAKDDLDYMTMEDIKLGMGVDKHGNPLEDLSIFEIVKIGAIGSKRGEPIYFDELDDYLQRIVDAKNANEILPPQIIDTKSTWGTNNNWKEVMQTYLPDLADVNGKIISKQSMISISTERLEAKANGVESKDTVLWGLVSGSITLSKIFNNDKPILSYEDYIQDTLNELKKKVIWYDFEAFSLPICPLDGFLPYQQVVSQVSIIRTMNGVEYSKDNIVIDPKNITHEDQANIIRAIYRDGHKFVVYNKGYENTRLKEIIQVLRHYEYDGVEELAEMVDYIINNTIDLADMFACKAKELPPVLIPQLKAKHSIKLVEKYITKYWPNLPYKIKEYANLAIPQGMKAMETANNRAVGIIEDNAWAEKVEQLKEYCENDVRAMIMVYVFIDELMKGKNA